VEGLGHHGSHFSLRRRFALFDAFLLHKETIKNNSNLSFLCWHPPQITTNKESGLGESPSLWTNNCNLIGVLRTGFESDWKKATS
jgi:hypothetical protein